MHFCQDELLMFMALLPFIGHYFDKWHAMFHVKKNHKDHY